MTRIIAGEWRGRRLVLPADRRVRPTSDRVREAWLSIMAPWIPGARVLDLFAGSGGLGLEALSRGARQATFVDLNPASVDAIKRNLNTLGASDRATVLRRDALRYLSRLGGTRFDVAFADPPYGFAGAAQTVERFLAAPFARVFAIEHQADVDLPEGAEGRDTRRYGETAITFYYAL